MKIILLALLFITNHPFQWESGRPLQWSDYKGECKSDAAATCTNIYMETSVDKEGYIFFSVKAVFIPEMSYVSPTSSRSEELLRHERLHFDLTEVYARRLKYRLAQFQHTRNKQDVREAEYWYTTIVDEWRKAQATYDLESEHSQNEIFQKSWEARIKNELEKSKQYANKPSPELPEIRRR